MSREGIITHIDVAEELRAGGSIDFIGAAHGSEVSFFWEQMAPGTGPALHRHPYSERFVVQDGEATFTLAREMIVVHGASIVVAPARTPHRFVNSGSTALRMINIHAATEMETEWLDPETWEVLRTTHVRA